MARRQGMMYAGGTPDFDERTGEPTGDAKPAKNVKGTTVDPLANDEATIPGEEVTMPEDDGGETIPGDAQDTAITTFTFVEGKERGDAAADYLYSQSGEVQQVTEAELRAYFNDPKKVNRLPEVFGTFDNYLAYMTEREQLIQSGEYDLGDWANADANLTVDQRLLLAGDADLFVDASDPTQSIEYINRQVAAAQTAGYNNWINSKANQALLEKYGVSPTVYSKTGDKFQWNGSAYVKTIEQDHAGLTDYVKMAIMVGIGAATGQAVSVLAPSLGTVGSAVVGNAITQGITTGKIDPDQLLQTAATAGFSTALNQYIGPEISKALGGLDLTEITGIEQVDNVLNAMGQTAIRQAVFDGDLDMDQIVSSGLFATATEFLNWLESRPDVHDPVEWNARTTEQIEDLNMDLLEEDFAESLGAALAQQESDSMSDTLKALQASLQPIYESAYATDLSSSPPGESTIDAAGSEFADTTADLTQDTTEQGPIPDFAEGDRSPGSILETSDDFRDSAAYLETDLGTREIDGITYERVEPTPDNPQGLGRVISIADDANIEDVFDALVLPENQYASVVSADAYGVSDPKLINWLWDQAGQEASLAGGEFSGASQREIFEGYFIDADLKLTAIGNTFVILDGQTPGVSDFLDNQQLETAGTRVTNIDFTDTESNLVEELQQAGMSEQESEAFLNELRESSMQAEAPAIPDLDSEIEVPDFFDPEDETFEIDEPLEPPEPPETVEPTDRQTDQESAAGPESAAGAAGDASTGADPAGGGGGADAGAGSSQAATATSSIVESLFGDYLDNAAQEAAADAYRSADQIAQVVNQAAQQTVAQGGEVTRADVEAAVRELASQTGVQLTDQQVEAIANSATSNIETGSGEGTGVPAGELPEEATVSEQESDPDRQQEQIADGSPGVPVEPDDSIDQQSTGATDPLAPVDPDDATDVTEGLDTDQDPLGDLDPDADIPVEGAPEGDEAGAPAGQEGGADDGSATGAPEGAETGGQTGDPEGTQVGTQAGADATAPTGSEAGTETGTDGTGDSAQGNSDTGGMLTGEATAEQTSDPVTGQDEDFDPSASEPEIPVEDVSEGPSDPIEDALSGTGAGTGTGGGEGTGVGSGVGEGQGTGTGAGEGSGVGDGIGAGTGTGVGESDGVGFGGQEGAGTGDADGIGTGVGEQGTGTGMGGEGTGRGSGLEGLGTGGLLLGMLGGQQPAPRAPVNFNEFYRELSQFDPMRPNVGQYKPDIDPVLALNQRLGMLTGRIV